MQGLAVYLVTLGMQTALQEEPSLLRTMYVAVCWMLMQGMEETDGGILAVGTVQLLCIAVLMLAGMLYLPALYALVCAGACMGCMVWCLHPAKCRFGSTGSFLLGGTVPLLLLMRCPGCCAGLRLTEALRRAGCSRSDVLPYLPARRP